MKKIMFNTKYGLEQAVLNGIKTITRRFLHPSLYLGNGEYDFTHAPFHVGDVVAIAQSYRDAGIDPGRNIPLTGRGNLQARADTLEGWSNKMFTKSELLPHRIRITKVRVERLQDITEEDIYAEGIGKQKEVEITRTAYGKTWSETFIETPLPNGELIGGCPRDAFAYLIDKLNGCGTWLRNPLVLVYSFDLVC